MSLQSHLTELEKKHQALERELHAVITSPSADDLQVAEIKRRKLQLKDEINRLKEAVSAPTLH
jgi:hypothetical protein